ncbi:MAG: hypothetical protein HKN37_13115 [Rhodothermales bacterium]|nr:hypothetical protein [Rhodothermales bacterium]
MRRIFQSILTLAIAVNVAACVSPGPEAVVEGPVRLTASPIDAKFGDYWYQGLAEITSYDLEQSRYGAMHPGTAVNIFVTEDLSRSRQVKLDDQGNGDRDAVTVLKLNATRKFNTGIYPYSIMTSVFTPVNRDRDPHTLKLTASIQEWCGQTFAQLNRTADGYRARHYSYFEDEGDADEQIAETVLEDELWNIVRLNPTDLPTGAIRVMPAASYLRFSHSEWKPQSASASVGRVNGESDLMEFRLTYDGIPRELLIRYRAAFPFEIEYWEESGGRSAAGDELVTRATMKERILLDYWTRNRPGDNVLRDQLGL